MRQLIIESAVLATGAGAAGLMLAVWGAEAIKRLAPANIPRLAETGIDGSVLAFTLAVSVISSLIFGLAPALAASKVDLNESLKQGAAKSVIGGGAGRLRAGLVVAEIALSVVLLAGAGLLMRSFDALANVNLGFRPEKILVAETSVPASSTEQALKRVVPFDRDMLADARIASGCVVGRRNVRASRQAGLGWRLLDRLFTSAGSIECDRAAGGVFGDHAGSVSDARHSAEGGAAISTIAT